MSHTSFLGRPGVSRLGFIAAMAGLANLPLLPGPASAEQFYSLGVNHRPGLYLVDTDFLGMPILIGDAPYTSRFRGLVPAEDNSAYTFDSDSDSILTVSLEDASILNSVLLDQDFSNTGRGYSLSPDGVLYGVMPGLDLRTIDPQTGTTTHIAAITGDASIIDAMAFAPDGTLYTIGRSEFIAPSTLYTLDTDTGALTLVGALGLGSQALDTLVFGEDGYLYGTDSPVSFNTDLYQIDPANGGSSYLGLTYVSGTAAMMLVQDEILFGDADGDGFVGVSDLDMILANYGTNDPVADINGSGGVGSGDLEIVLANWGGGAFPAGTVPEPGTLALVGFAGLVLLRRR